MLNLSTNRYTRLMFSLLNFLDSDGSTSRETSSETVPSQIGWSRFFPFLFLHAGMLGVIWCGWSWFAVGLALALYWVRMFAITAFYHRYFSHRSFKTGRIQQFVFAVWAMTSVQRGPLWWASHHRLHHQKSDQPEDPHSPLQKGFFRAHIGWMAIPENLITYYERVQDWCRFPELVFLNRFDWIVPLLYAVALYGLGVWLQLTQPNWHTNGFQLLIWGFFISTVLLFHGTCTINSLAHQFGSRRYPTTDTSRNNFWLALITLGEGWHNNHHQYQFTARQGFYWWEIDVTYYILKGMSWVGLVSELRPVPRQAYAVESVLPASHAILSAHANTHGGVEPEKVVV